MNIAKGNRKVRERKFNKSHIDTLIFFIFLYV